MAERLRRAQVVECGALLRKAYLNPRGEQVAPRFCDRSVLLQPSVDERYFTGRCLRCGNQVVEAANGDQSLQRDAAG